MFGQMRWHKASLIPPMARKAATLDEGRRRGLAAGKTLGIQLCSKVVFAQFGLLVKQALYFDRYTKLLAPDLDLVRDYRVVGLDDARAGAIDV